MVLNEEIITAIDIGTGKIFGLSGIMKDTGLEVIATDVQTLPEDIIKKGQIADSEEVSNSIFSTLQSLKKNVGERIEWVTIGIGGGHLKGSLISKRISIEPQGREIGETDFQMLKREIKNAVIAANGTGRKVLYSVPQEYRIDDLSGIKKEPVGMHGNTLEMKVHIITVDINQLHNITDCVKNAGAQIENVYPHSWAAAEAVLTEEEKKVGCLLIDIGKGTTDIVFFSEGSIIMTDSIRVGSGNVDVDLAKGLHTPVAFAEEIKKKHGWCNYPKMISEKEKTLSDTVEIFNLSGKLSRTVRVEEISRIVYERMREIFEDFVKHRVEKPALLHTTGAGVIITGGGAKLKGITDLAESVFELPARASSAKSMFNMDESFQQTEFTTGIGLLMLASKQERKREKPDIIEKAKKLLGKWF
ncbi:MAG: cell division protein FtsA [Candidatus Omnitrophica bacterium]|nr:cell division protein FtsA [Candidatus Omnitrophota bacterium]